MEFLHSVNDHIYERMKNDPSNWKFKRFWGGIFYLISLLIALFLPFIILFVLVAFLGIVIFYLWCVIAFLLNISAGRATQFGLEKITHIIKYKQLYKFAMTIGREVETAWIVSSLIGAFILTILNVNIFLSIIPCSVNLFLLIVFNVALRS